MAAHEKRPSYHLFVTQEPATDMLPSRWHKVVTSSGMSQAVGHCCKQYWTGEQSTRSTSWEWQVQDLSMGA